MLTATLGLTPTIACVPDLEGVKPREGPAHYWGLPVPRLAGPGETATLAIRPAPCTCGKKYWHWNMLVQAKKGPVELVTYPQPQGAGADSWALVVAMDSSCVGTPGGPVAGAGLTWWAVSEQGYVPLLDLAIRCPHLRTAQLAELYASTLVHQHAVELQSAHPRGGGSPPSAAYALTGSSLVHGYWTGRKRVKNAALRGLLPLQPMSLPFPLRWEHIPRELNKIADHLAGGVSGNPPAPPRVASIPFHTYDQGHRAH